MKNHSITRKSIIKPELKREYPNKSKVKMLHPIKKEGKEDWSVVGKEGFVLDYYETYNMDNFYIVWLDGYSQPITVEPEKIGPIDGEVETNEKEQPEFTD